MSETKQVSPGQQALFDTLMEGIQREVMLRQQAIVMQANLEAAGEQLAAKDERIAELEFQVNSKTARVAYLEDQVRELTPIPIADAA